MRKGKQLRSEGNNYAEPAYDTNNSYTNHLILFYGHYFSFFF